MNETLTEPPLSQRWHKTQGLTHLIARQGMKAGWLDAPPVLQDLAESIS